MARTTASAAADSVAAALVPDPADGGADRGALLGTSSGQPGADPGPEATGGGSDSVDRQGAESAAAESPALPPGSGQGERVVFDESAQHVWLVSASGAVRRAYPVSGSVVDNLRPGSYQVYSRSRHATSFNSASTMEFMVRFTQGERAAIGFHSIPVDPQGQRLQTREELGTPQSQGCIRQRRSDAVALWHFADVGTPVVVV